MRKPFAKVAVDSYISENLEDSKIIDLKDIDPKTVTKVLYKDLPKKVMNGYPIASNFVNKEGKEYTFLEYEKLSEEEKKGCELQYLYMSKYHELYVGTTGSGKTTGIMEPQLRAISSQKNKPNIFISDPKGELFDHNVKHLQKCGYRTFVINFRNFGKTDRWNPLEEIYDLYQTIAKIGEDYQEGTDKKELNKYDVYGDISSFEGHYYIYQDKAFITEDDFKSFILSEKYTVRSMVSTLVNQLTTAIIPNNPNVKDPTWENGARSLLNGIIQLMVELSGEPEKHFTREMMTLKTAHDIYLSFRDGCGGDEDAEERTEQLLEGRSRDVTDKVNLVLKTTDVTRKGFFATFEAAVASWMQGHIYKLTCDTTIDLKDSSKPFAIFVSTRDYEKSDNIIAGLFVDWVYRQSLLLADGSEKDENNVPTTRELHFLLDEFANIPPIPNFETKIATARSRNIWFHLFVQTYEQIDAVYSPSIAKIIVDNCNVQAFLGSQSYTTKQKFSNECGKHMIESLGSIFDDKRVEMVEMPVVPVSYLDLIEPGEVYVKRIYTPVICASYIRSYLCANLGIYKDFFDKDAVKEHAPINSVVPNDEAHTYSIFWNLSSKEEEIEDDDEIEGW